MPFQYLRDELRRRIRLTLSEPLTAADLIESVDRQLADGAWGYGLLVDARMIENGASSADTRAFLTHVRELVDVHGQRGPVALVARAMGAVAGAQTYVFLGNQTESAIEVFWDGNDAERWLDERLIT